MKTILIPHPCLGIHQSKVSCHTITAGKNCGLKMDLGCSKDDAQETRLGLTGLTKCKISGGYAHNPIILLFVVHMSSTENSNWLIAEKWVVKIISNSRVHQSKQLPYSKPSWHNRRPQSRTILNH